MSAPTHAGVPGNATATKERAPRSLVATRIVQEAVKENASIDDLAALAASDPAFAMRVIAVVNSTAFGVPHKVSDVPQACAMLGLRGLRNIALSLALSDMVPLGGDGEILLGNSLRRGVAARLIAERLGERKLDEFFTVGLLLEVGLLVQARDDLVTAADAARTPVAHRILFERASGNEGHPQRGARIVNDFSLGDVIAQAVRQHHDENCPSETFAKVAWLAESVAAIWEGGDIPKSRELAGTQLSQVGLSASDIDDIVGRVPELVSSAAESFQRDLPAQAQLQTLIEDANRSLLDMNLRYEQLVRRLESLLDEKDRLASQLKAANEQLTTLAATDVLTGLPNKRAFQVELIRSLARADRSGTWLGVGMVDVDFFKKVNDTYGHQTGDDVLQGVGAIVNKCLRTGDVAARYGGEEFVLLLPDSDLPGAKIAAERVRAAIEATEFQTASGPLHVTVSIGVCAAKGPMSPSARRDLLAFADAALYEAKRSGRNRVCMRELGASRELQIKV